MKIVNNYKSILLVLLMLSASIVEAQRMRKESIKPMVSIKGKSAVLLDSKTEYQIDISERIKVGEVRWSVKGGEVVEKSQFFAVILWKEIGKGEIVYDVLESSNGRMQGVFRVDITANAPDIPKTPGIQNQDCTSATLQNAGTIPSGEMWYWQGTTKEGTSTSSPATNSYPITKSGTYRLRARNTSTGVWSPKGSSVTVTLGSIGGTLWFKDDDLDGKGDPNNSQEFCSPPTSGNWTQNGNDLCPAENSNSANGCRTTEPFSNENYIYTITPQKETTDVSTLTATNDAIRTITYLDGLGRVKQTIGIMQSKSEKDIVTHVEYDNLGRQTKKYLPYPEVTGNGFLKSNALANTNSYYYDKYTTDFPGQTAQQINAYSEQVSGNSPLVKVYEQTAPGLAWKKGATMLPEGYSNGYTQKYVYTTNSANEVRKFDVQLTGSGNTFVPSLIGGTIFFSTGELTKNITKNENWSSSQTYQKNNTVEEFKDKMGRVLLKRAYANVDFNSDEDTSDSGEQEVPHDTYYIYDRFGNLSYVIPPKVTTNDISDEELSELCYQYKYDYRKRLIEKKTPGKDWEYIVYDSLNRPVLTQDALLRDDKKWAFTKYDKLGRAVYTGIYTATSGLSQVEMQTTFDSNHTTLEDNYETKVSSGTGEQDSYYTNEDFPSSSIEILTVNYYDDYNFNRAGTGLPDSIATAYEDLNSDVKGLATGIKVKTLDDSADYWTTTVTYYNDKEQGVYVYSKNEFLNTTDIISSQIDFAGKALEITSTHTNADDTVLGTQTIVDSFEYDHVGRLLSQTQNVNHGSVNAQKQIVENRYDEMGTLISKGVGGEVTTEKRLQTVDYAYNIRGWLTKINDDSYNDNDLFNFSINYNNPASGTALFNGNISQISWNTANIDASTKTYTYAYDAMDRIVSAIDNTGKYNLQYVSYDRNGNIKKLKRQGHITANPDVINTSDFGMMDNLSYEYYDNSNRLKKVSDTGNSTYGFKDGANLANEYIYDTSGNLISDANKDIQSISYNYLGLAKDITSATDTALNGTISYVYDAVGTKLEKKVVEVGASTTITRYAGNYVYKKVIPVVTTSRPIQLTLEFFNHPEGYVKPNYNIGRDGENQFLINYSYVYQYRDHLDNVRVTYSDADRDGIVDALTCDGVCDSRGRIDLDGDNDFANEIIEESNYYPFGLQMRGYNRVVSSNGNSTAQKFKYNGKEYEEALGVNFYEMDVRSLDPTLGRWFSIDPVTHHSQSTYNAFDNNPIYYADPSGADSDDRNRTRMERNADPAQGAKSMGMAIYETTTTMTLTNRTQVNYSDGSSSTIEGTSESFEVSSVTHYGDGEVISSKSADVDFKITNKTTGTAKVRSYPVNNGNTYQVPTYKAILSGTDLKGKKISENFDVVRYGVVLKTKKGIPYIAGLSDKQSYIAKWDPKTMYNSRTKKYGGSWRIFGNYLVHQGVKYPNKTLQGNNACISICGVKEYGGVKYSAWVYFKFLVGKISGKSYKKTTLGVSYEKVTNRPKLKKI